MVRRLLLFFLLSAWTLDDDDVATWPPFHTVRRRTHSHRQPSPALAISDSGKAGEGHGQGASASTFRLRDDDCIANRRDNHVRHGSLPDVHVYLWPVAPAAVVVVCIGERIVLESPALLCVCVCVRAVWKGVRSFSSVRNQSRERGRLELKRWRAN